LPCHILHLFEIFFGANIHLFEIFSKLFGKNVNILIVFLPLFDKILTKIETVIVTLTGNGYQVEAFGKCFY